MPVSKPLNAPTATALELLILGGSASAAMPRPGSSTAGKLEISYKASASCTRALFFAGLGLAVWGAAMLHLIFGNKYAAASPVIPVMAVLAPALCF
jgi:hypothetical protein